MYPTVKIATAAADTPVTLTEAKAHLRYDLTTEDTLITTLIKVATEYAEKRLSRALITQTWDLYLEDFPAEDTIILPFPPLQTISHVKYYDKNNILQTWASSNYDVDSIREPGRIVQSATGAGYPNTYDRPNAVNIRFVVGYGAASTNVPETIRAGIKLLISHLFENREGITVGQGNASQIPIPKSIEDLFGQLSLREMF